MATSPFPWRTHPQAPTAVFDAEGKMIVRGVGIGTAIDDTTAADNAAVIAAVPALVEALEAVQAEIVLSGHLAEIVDAALASIGRAK